MPVAGGGCPAGGVEDGLQRLALDRLLRHRTHHPAAADRREHGRAAFRVRADAGNPAPPRCGARRAGRPAVPPPPRLRAPAPAPAAPRSASAPTPVTPAPLGPVPTGRSGERRVTDTARRGGRRAPPPRRRARAR